MSQIPSTLTAQQRALQALALRQLQAIQTTLQRLLSVTTEQADLDSIRDSLGNTAASVDLLLNWFGTEPEWARDDLQDDVEVIVRPGSLPD